MSENESVGFEVFLELGRFKTGFRSVNRSFTELDKRADNVGKTSGGISGGFAKAAGSARSLVAGLAGFAGVGAVVSMVGGAVSSLFAQMPEIQMAFQRAGLVIMRNLVWPIMQAVLPLLVKMLSWVSRNRALFAQLGEVGANAFRAVFHIAKLLFNLLAGGFSKISNIIGAQKITFNDFINFLNLMLLAVTILFVAVANELEPLVDLLAGLIGGLLKNIIGPFILGLDEGFGGLSTVLDMLAGNFRALVAVGQEVAAVFGDSQEETAALSAGAFSLGKALGTVLRFGVQSLGKALGFQIKIIRLVLVNAAKLIKFLIGGIKKTQKAFKTLGLVVKAIMLTISGRIRAVANNIKSLFSRGIDFVVSKVTGIGDALADIDLSGIIDRIQSKIAGLGKGVARKITGVLFTLLSEFEQSPIGRAFLFATASLGPKIGDTVRKLFKRTEKDDEPEGRARGGKVLPGRRYLVGENQPEILIPDRSGEIIPSVPSGGSAANVTQNFNVNVNLPPGSAPETQSAARQGVQEALESLRDKYFDSAARRGLLSTPASL